MIRHDFFFCYIFVLIPLLHSVWLLNILVLQRNITGFKNFVKRFHFCKPTVKSPKNIHQQYNFCKQTNGAPLGSVSQRISSLSGGFRTLVQRGAGIFESLQIELYHIKESC